jgi:hypothetical protein
MLRVYSARVCGMALLVGAPYLHAQGSAPFDAAAAFGARADVTALRLSPDGQRVAFVAPYKGQGSVATTLSLTPGAKPKVAFYTDGKPFRVRGAVVESTRMADALKAAGAQSELITYQDLDDQLEDSAARTDMLRKSDAFLRHSFGMGP